MYFHLKYLFSKYFLFVYGPSDRHWNYFLLDSFLLILFLKSRFIEYLNASSYQIRRDRILFIASKMWLSRLWFNYEFLKQILFYSIFDTFQFHEENELLISNKQEITQGNVQILEKFAKKVLLLFLHHPFKWEKINIRAQGLSLPTDNIKFVICNWLQRGAKGLFTPPLLAARLKHLLH